MEDSEIPSTRLDRQLQFKILKACACKHPDECDLNELFCGKNEDGIYGKMDPEQAHNIASNIAYLIGHKTIESEGFGCSFYETRYSFGTAVITKDGLDLLLDDGGLSAILRMFTVRFETDQLRALVEARIKDFHAPPEEKKRLTTALLSLSGESIKHLTLKLLDSGLDHLPDAMMLIRTYLSTPS